MKPTCALFAAKAAEVWGVIEIRTANDLPEGQKQLPGSSDGRRT